MSKVAQKNLKNAPNTKAQTTKPAKKLNNNDSSVAEVKNAGAADYLMKDKRWKEVFIPTITHAFFISDEPFKRFKRESVEFLKTVQEVFDVSFLDIAYTLNLRDGLVEKVHSSSQDCLAELKTWESRHMSVSTARNHSLGPKYSNKSSTSSNRLNMQLIRLNARTTPGGQSEVTDQHIMPRLRP